MEEVREEAADTGRVRVLPRLVVTCSGRYECGVVGVLRVRWGRTEGERDIELREDDAGDPMAGKE